MPNSALEAPRSLTKQDFDIKTVSRLITSSATFGTTLHIICLICYGHDIYEVDSLELYARLQDDFGAILSEAGENRLQAILTATSTDIFYEDPDAFSSICNALAEGDPGLDGMNDLTVPEILWALYEVEVNRDPVTMNPAIAALIAREMAEEANDVAGEEDPTAYVFDFLSERRAALHEQLKALGVKDITLPPLKTPPSIRPEDLK